MAIVYSTKKENPVSVLQEALKDIRINSKFGKLPLREDMLCLGSEELEKQWDKLRMLRKHLYIISEYIFTNKNETINQWLKKNNKELSHLVMNQIGDYNNETGGITAYMINLEMFYDKEEEKYNNMEKAAKVPDELKKEIEFLRQEREFARDTRRQIRKLKTKELKKTGKGYLLVKLGEPKKEEIPVKKEEVEKKNNEEKKEAFAAVNGEDEKKDTNVDKVIDTDLRRNISIMIAGAIITITAFGIAASLTNK